MAAEIVMAQVDGAAQVSQLLAASGSKTFTVGKVATAAGAGNNTILTLTPAKGGAAIAVKLEGARQAAELSALVGKTVAVGKPTMMAGAAAANNWLIFQPVGAGAVKAAAGSATLLKLEGARQGMQAAALTGQKFTVVQPVMAGNIPGSTLFLQPAGGGDIVAIKLANGTMASNLVGKTVMVGKAPTIAGGNAANWLVLKPAGSATAVKAAGAAAGAKTAGATAAKATAPMIKMQTVALTTTTTGATTGAATGVTQAATAGKTLAAGSAAKTVAASGTIWKGTGLSLGLGLGLGAWGPVILAGVGASAAYGYWRSKRNAADDVVVQEA
ncbi:MAG: hypothetical protein HQL47_02945 [Gammaproteobacteria bacterium]|nr:hypothetical protein [Gammaproteobacteria bacterium]